MKIANSYNPNPTTVNSILQNRQNQFNAARDQGLVTNEDVAKPVTKNPKVLGVEITPDYEDKGFFRKVGEDAAMLAYSIPVGLAKVGTGLVTHPIQTVKELAGGLKQSVKDLVDVDYYKAHPLLGIVNLAGVVMPVAGAAKSAAVKTATISAASTLTKEAIALGVEETVASTVVKQLMTGTKIFKGSPLRTAVDEAYRVGKTNIVAETIRTSLSTAGVADDVALRVGNSVADSMTQQMSRASTKMQVLESIAHPVRSTGNFIAAKSEPLRKMVFGEPAQTAVGVLYGADVVKKNPEGFLQIERWAEAQTVERGIDNNVLNRQRIMQEWTEQNSEWGALSPEQRIEHFQNYAKQDLIRLKLHESTGVDIVTTKALPQKYVDAMVETVKSLDESTPIADIAKVLEDNFGRDFSSHIDEITTAIKNNPTKAGMIEALSKMGNSRSLVSFAKFSPDVQKLASELEGTGYRIGYAPTNKRVSFVTDVMAASKGSTVVNTTDIMASKTRFGQWIDKIGLSPRGVVEGAAEFSYRENFTQRVLTDLADEVDGVIKAKNMSATGDVMIPVEKLFEWLDNNRTLFLKARKRKVFPIRTVFDITKQDLLHAGIDASVASKIVAIGKQALREVPSSIVGMGDKVVNYLRTSNKGFGSWMSNVYDGYLKTAYKGRYDWSPFFAAQTWLETRINSSLLLKDARALPGAGTVMKLGDWTAERLGRKLETTKSYLSKVIDEPPLEEISMVRSEILGNLQKTMLDATTPDMMNIQNAAMGGIKTLEERALFEESIRSKNVWYSVTKQSSVRMATTFNKALAYKFGMTIEKALEFSMENGQKVYKNPQLVQLMKDATQEAYHYKVGALTSPLVKTLNVVFFPFRFQAKTVQMASKWLGSLSPVSRMTVMNNWVHFANWAGTDEGIKWRRTNRNYFYNIFTYTTAYEQIGQAISAVTKGRLFGGNAGLIGGVPFGFMVNLARELAFIPGDTDQFDPKTGKQFTGETPEKVISLASLSSAIEQLVISISPSTPFYSLTGGVISGISPTKLTVPLIRSILGASREGLQGDDPTKGREMLERDFKRVPLDYTRFSE